MIKRLSIFFFFICLVVNVQADIVDSTSVEQRAEQVDWRVPSKEKIDEFRKDSAFDYNQLIDPRSLLEMFFDWIKSFFPDGTINSQGFSTFLQVIKYAGIAIIVALLVYVILRLLGVNFRAILGKEKIQSSIEGIDLDFEDGNSLNLQKLIMDAIAEKNYRLAIRYTYLFGLKRMADKGLILWNPTKTNLSYLHEIKDENIRKYFLRNTYIFDYVWYGDRELDAEEFNIAFTRLSEFNDMIANEK